MLHYRKVSSVAEIGEKFLLRKKISFCSRKVPSVAETEDKPTLQLLPLDLDSTFTHKPDQIELQLDWSQLLYSENLDLVP